MAKVRTKPKQPRRPFYDEEAYVFKNPYLLKATENYPERIINPTEAIKLKNNWREFAKGREIHLEIGPGKGRFITEYAMANPDTLVVGMEIKFKRLYKISKRLSEAKALNSHIIRFDADFVDWIFGENELDRLFLFFPDPWAKKERYQFKRTISKEFLETVHKMLAKDGCFEIKTDNNDYFEYMLETIKDSPLAIEGMTRDLANSEYAEGNIETIFEEKFRLNGLKANYLKLRPKG